MTAFDNITKAKAIWGLSLPNVACPDDATLHQWLVMFGLEDYETACGRMSNTQRRGWTKSPRQFWGDVKTALYRLRDARRKVIA